MSGAAKDRVAVLGRKVRKTFRRARGETVTALDDVSLEVRHGALTALVGPDGAGKTTLIRLIAGLMPVDGGELEVMGFDVAAAPQAVQDRIAYMPQRFGLYEDLTVLENLDLYADLHGVPKPERADQYRHLLDMTALAPFTARLAGKLSGGMKQKLGLACTLVRAPELLLLDEPTVGVDPLSRRELWDIVWRLVREDGLSVLLSTAYLDEAERCDHVLVLREGKVLASGPPAKVSELAAGRTFRAEPGSGEPARALQSRLIDDPGIVDAVPEAGHVRLVRTGSSAGTADTLLAGHAVVPVHPRLEDGFMILLRQQAPARTASAAAPRARRIEGSGDTTVIEVRDLVRKFGEFTAVNHVSFRVRRGEIFGLLGPNGAGKTTTFRMLCGLLPATSGTLRVAGLDLRTARASARRHIGYVAQKFSLYGQLSVAENLEFFASAYGLRGAAKRARMDWAVHHFELGRMIDLPSGQLPGGFKQRLAMAAALLHEPEILFLDEPTSGADPLARREFWQRITALAKQGVTVIVTTHFMEEAEYCDRIVIQAAGTVLAEGTPAEVRRQGTPRESGEPTMEDAFIAIVEAARRRVAGAAGRSA
ncbi:MAG TPA: ATP-binding cassette domain-containing protein [Alphaproteobacteria bacterium]|nr:ATP-binding cassette domain-containing protein [Alphaproteobacteria bacterium]